MPRGLPDFKFVVAGVDELLEKEDFGERTRMLVKALDKSALAAPLLVIFRPRIFWKRLLAKDDGFPFEIIKRGISYTLYRKTDSLYYLTTHVFLPQSIPIVWRLGQVLLGRAINQGILSHIQKRFNLWYANPRISTIIAQLGWSRLFFDCIDNQVLHPQKSRYSIGIGAEYDWAAKFANRLVIAAESQRGIFPGRDCYMLQNGIDEIFFKNQKAADLGSGRPVIGYAGSLQDRIDIGIVETLALGLPNVDIVFVGPFLNKEHFKPLFNYPNIKFIGRKPFQEIPSYLAAFDIGIVPHVVNEFTDSMNPLKIYEYLAAGLNVVSTRIAGSEDFSNYIDICDDGESFLEAVRSRLAVKRESADLRRESRRHSWESRIRGLVQDLRLVDIDVQGKE